MWVPSTQHNTFKYLTNIEYIKVVTTSALVWENIFNLIPEINTVRI